MDRIRILLADDHPVFRRGLTMLLPSEAPELEVVASLSDGDEVIAFLDTCTVDMMLLDARMPRLDGIETARQVRSRAPLIKIIILTTFGDSATVRAGLSIGIDGFLLKDAPVEEIVRAIKAVVGGDRYFSQHALRILADSVAREDQSHQGQRIVNSLTIRQQEVLQQIARGKRNNEIAEILCLSERTVRNYVHQIYEAIGVHSRGEVVFWARERGLG